MIRRLALASSLLAVPTVAQGADWPQFRGPGGLARSTSEVLPAALTPDGDVLWEADVVPGHSSPVIAGGRIFLTGFAEGRDVALCLDQKTGETLWEKSFEGQAGMPFFHPDAELPALPTPVTDGERVVFYFGNYGLVAYDLEGKQQWEKRLPYPGYGFGVGSSPLLHEGLLVVPRDGAPEAAVLVLDVTDGEELWRMNRFQFQESHGSPFLWSNADRDELIVGGTNQLTSYDLGSGEILWTVSGTCGFPCTTPTADEDTLYYAAWSTGEAEGRSFWEAAFTRSLELSDEEVADPALLFRRLDKNEDGKVVPDEVPECRAKDAFGFIDSDRDGVWTVEELTSPPKGASNGRNLMVAVKRGGSGDVTKTHVRWTWTRGLPYVSSPLEYGGRLWLFKSGGIVTCLDAATGKPVFDRERLGDRGEYYMSPVGVADRVLIGSAEGTFYVLDAKADELSVLAEVDFGDELFATPAVLDGRVYLRSKSKLWAFGAPAGQ